METKQARFEELKAKGATRTKDEKKEFAALKAELEGEMVDHVVTQEDLDNNPDLVEQGVAVGETIQVNKDDLSPETLHNTAAINDAEEPVAPVAPAKAAKASKLAKTESTGQFVMIENVRHNDQEFKIGQDIAADHKYLPVFIAEGFAREKKLS